MTRHFLLARFPSLVLVAGGIVVGMSYYAFVRKGYQLEANRYSLLVEQYHQIAKNQSEKIAQLSGLQEQKKIDGLILISSEHAEALYALEKGFDELHEFRRISLRAGVMSDLVRAERNVNLLMIDEFEMYKKTGQKHHLKVALGLNQKVAGMRSESTSRLRELTDD